LLFVGVTGHEAGITLNGKLTHEGRSTRKTARAIFSGSDSGLSRLQTQYEGKAKLKYLLQLDDEIVERIKLLAKPYPMRHKQRERCA
jgi:hypothetical protein